MEEVKTKRGKIGFGEEKILLEENYLDYFHNLERELWHNGESHHKLGLALFAFTLSYTVVMVVAAAFFLNLQSLLVFAASVTVVYGLLWMLQRKREFTTDNKISYDDIQEVKLVEGRNWLTCPRFIIKYQKEETLKKRYVAMHSHLIPGVDERIQNIKENFESKQIKVS